MKDLREPNWFEFLVILSLLILLLLMVIGTDFCISEQKVREVVEEGRALKEITKMALGK